MYHCQLYTLYILNTIHSVHSLNTVGVAHWPLPRYLQWINTIPTAVLSSEHVHSADCTGSWLRPSSSSSLLTSSLQTRLLFVRQTDRYISDGPGVRSPFERRLRHFRWPVHSTFALSFGYHKIFYLSRQVSARCHDQDEGPVRPYILLFCRNTECSAHLRKRHIK